MSSRSALLHGPIARQLLGLAWPVLVVLALQTFVAVAETWFVSFLGTDALAGVALVFPLFMLMTMMSNGAIGGGVSAAVARALGAGRARDAHALAWHAAVLGAAFGAVFMAGVWAGGPALFRKMGAQGETLAAAVLYANIVFLAAIPGWIANLLAAALRGAGNVRVPAIVTAAGSVATLALSPLFIFGWGWVPAMGVAGAGGRDARYRGDRPGRGGFSARLAAPLQHRARRGGGRLRLPRARGAVLLFLRRRHVDLLRQPGRGPHGVALRRRPRAPRHRLGARLLLDKLAGRVAQRPLLDRGCGLYRFRRDQPVRDGERLRLGTQGGLGICNVTAIAPNAHRPIPRFSPDLVRAAAR